MLLEVDHFSLSFTRYDGLVRQKRIEALHDLSFDLARGEVLALVGASGAGKSLLAHAIFGILPPNAISSGALRLNGAELDQKTLPKLRGRRMGLVPQSVSHLDPLVRCGRQLAWAAERSGGRAEGGDIAGALAQFNLDAGVSKLFPHQLSGGIARRVMLAIATIGKPDLVVADEPTSGLDPDNGQVILTALREQANGGRGVLLITHDLAQAVPLADRVAVLNGGRLVGVEEAKDFADQGHDLVSPYARALWQAMPQNQFGDVGVEHA